MLSRSPALRAALPAIIATLLGEPLEPAPGPRPGPTQCHDITTFPAIGLAGGACEGYGLLLDIRNPADFQQMAKLVRPEDVEGRMLISSDLEAHRVAIQRYLDMGFDRIYLHNVGRNQEAWAEAFGREVLPRLTA